MIRPQCPDCSFTMTGQGSFKHDKTCPASAAFDQVMASDRQFFVDHPHTDEFYRPISRVEQQEWIYSHPGAPVPKKVHVCIHRPSGYRTRMYLT